MACCNCAHSWSDPVRMVARRPQCRRCGSNQVACLRPWHEDKLPLLRKDPRSLTDEEKAERERMVRNGQIVAAFGQVACLALVARGVGPDTAARILQKVSDPQNPNFWREILQAELTFARTSAFWKR
jgi:ATP-dependent helicase Lhr and Lhr-like helicase